MSAKKTGASDRLEGIATCGICLELYDDPRVLPCGHTFCQKCIHGMCRNNPFKFKPECPMDRKKFMLPVGGAETLPINIAVRELAEIRRKRSADECIEHCDKSVDLYCYDCQRNVCLVCATTKHKSHSQESIEDAKAKACSQLDDNEIQLLNRASLLTKESDQLLMSEHSLMQKIRDTKQAVIKRAEVLKREISEQTTKLTSQLEDMETSILQDIACCKLKSDMSIGMLQSCAYDMRNLKDKGKNCEVTAQAEELNANTKQLLQTHVTSTKYNAPDFHFQSSRLPTELVGVIIIE